MNEDLADYAVKYLGKLGASYSEAKLESQEGNGFVLKNGIPQISGFDTVSGLGIRFLVNNTLGFIAVNELKKDKIKDIINRSFELTKRAVKIGEKVNFANDNINKKKYKVNQRINFKDLEPSEKIKVLFELEDSIKETKVKSPGRYFYLSDSLVKKYYINSEGSNIIAEVPLLNFYYTVSVESNGQNSQKFLQFGGSGGYELLKEWKLNDFIKKEVKNMDNNLKNGVKVPNVKLDLVLGPEVTGIAVHESVGHPYEADRIFGREAAQAGESFVNKNMINNKIANDFVNVVDDPTIEDSFGFYLYDDEGVKAKRKYLIKNGKINEFLHNRQTAYVMNVKSNGCARANHYDKEPLIRMSNTFMLPGSYNEDELIEDIKLGVYMRDYQEWNIDDKRFHQKYVGNDCYLIENGKITKPVKKPILEITTPAFWKSIDVAGNKVEFTAGTCGKGESMQAIPVLFGGPMIRLREIKLK